MNEFEVNRKKFVAAFGLMMVAVVPMVLACDYGNTSGCGGTVALVLSWIALSLVLAYGLALEVKW